VTINICRALLDHLQTGVFDPALKGAIAGRIATVALLQLDYELGDEDSLRKARESGRRVLRQYVTADCYCPAEANAAITICIDELSGLMFDRHTPKELRNNCGLMQQFPPRRLKGLCNDLNWQSPETLRQNRKLQRMIKEHEAARIGARSSDLPGLALANSTVNQTW